MPMKREPSFDLYTRYLKRQKIARSAMRWNYRDIIALLKGILEYQEIKGVHPTSDSRGFHDFIKESLHLEFNRRQVVTKIRGLKRLYTGANLPHKGYSRMIIKPSNQLAYELAKKIWGEEVDDDVVYVDMDGKVHYLNFSKAKAAHQWPTCDGKNGSWQEKEGNRGQLLGESSMSNGFSRNVSKVELEAHQWPTCARKNGSWREKEGNCVQLLGESSVSNYSNGFSRNVSKVELEAHQWPTCARRNGSWQENEGNCGQLIGESNMSNGFNRKVFKVEPDDHNSSHQIWGKFGTN